MNIQQKVVNFSIIIPHYNIPELLIRCVKSIPVREDIQVIVVDDCSPNASLYLSRYPDLCRPYLEFYTTTKGGSAGRARNVGLDHARGKWIVCLDADDLLVDSAIEIFDSAIDSNADILFYNYYSRLSSDLSKEGERGFYQEWLSKYRETGNDYEIRYMFDAMWSKIFRREMVERNHIRCSETLWGNDCMFSLKCGIFADSICYIDKPFFIITQRDGSLANSQFGNNIASEEEYKTRVTVATDVILFGKKHNVFFNRYLRYGDMWRLYKYYRRSAILYILKTLFEHPKTGIYFMKVVIKNHHVIIRDF